MSQPVVLLVRFQSPLSLEEVLRISEERIADFRAIDGLLQKHYMRDVQSGHYAGLYLWRSMADVVAFQDSELRASIKAVYQVQGEPRIEVYDVSMSLREAESPAG